MIFKAWYKFWFQEQSPLPLAIFRIFFSGFVLQMIFGELVPNFYPFFGVKGLIDISTVCTHWWQNNPVFDLFLLLPPDNLSRLIFFWVFVVFVLFLMVGFCTRLSALVVYCGLLSLHRQCPMVLNGSDDLMRLFSFLLIFSPAGAACSVDSFLKNKDEHERGKRAHVRAPLQTAPWVQRMMQVQISLVYLSSFLCKISGSQWQQGTAAYYAAHRLEFQKLPLPWLTDHSPGYQILTYYTLFVELAMSTLVWYRPWRYWVLLAGICMHAGIDWTMNLPCFEWLFVASYINFIDPADLQKMIKLLTLRLPRLPSFLYAWALKPVSIVLAVFRSCTVRSPHWQFPVLLVIVSTLLVVGALAAVPVRMSYVALESRHNYNRRLFNAQSHWLAELHHCDQLPDNNERKLFAQNAMALVFSLTEHYKEAAALWRHICRYRIEQNLPYDQTVVKTMSSLGGIYLETGHLDASQLCYQTILNYDLTHLPNARLRTAIDLNNLAVLSYFRSFLNSDRSSQYLGLEKTNNLYIQSLDELHLSNLLNKEPFVNQQQRALAEAALNILSNQSLSLRDSWRLKEARQAKAKLAKLQSKFI